MIDWSNWEQEYEQRVSRIQKGGDIAIPSEEIYQLLKSLVSDNLILSETKEDFLKGFGSDLKKKFPNGEWKTINGAKVFVNGANTVIAGLDGFNKEIDKFFEGKKKESEGKKTKLTKEEIGSANLRYRSNVIKEKYDLTKEESNTFLQTASRVAWSKTKKEGDGVNMKLNKNEADSLVKKGLLTKKDDKYYLTDLGKKEADWRENASETELESQSTDKPEAKKEEISQLSEKEQKDFDEFLSNEDKKENDKIDNNKKSKKVSALMQSAMSQILKEIKHQLLPDSLTTYRYEKQMVDDAKRMEKFSAGNVKFKELERKFPNFSISEIGDHVVIKEKNGNSEYGFQVGVIPQLIYNLQEIDKFKNRETGVQDRQESMQKLIPVLISAVKEKGFNKVKSELKKGKKGISARARIPKSIDPNMDFYNLSSGEALDLMDRMETYIKKQSAK